MLSKTLDLMENLFTDNGYTSCLQVIRLVPYKSVPRTLIPIFRWPHEMQCIEMKWNNKSLNQQDGILFLCLTC